MSRLNSREIAKMRNELIQKYGMEYCIICNKTPEMLGVPHLQLHESKYTRPLDPNNFFFMCKGCNLQKSLRRELIIGTSSITAEHEKNLSIKPVFLKALYGLIHDPNNNYHVPYHQTIRQLAFLCKVETVTVKRWIDGLIDFPLSPYVTASLGLANTMHIFKRGHEPEDEDLF